MDWTDITLGVLQILSDDMYFTILILATLKLICGCVHPS
jgi:hypothetical protein